MKGNIHSIETMGLVDGPGIRFVVFMQGCPLRCLYCHNPDTWLNKENHLMEAEEIVKRCLKYKNYFGKDGGITFSGGEPLYQPEFLLEVLKLCKKAGINTCLDTSGYGNGNYDELLKYVDLVLFDIKALDNNNFKDITSGNLDKSLEFLSACQRNNKKMWIRQVIIPGINDNEDYIIKLKEFIKKLSNVDKVELLPYHTLGVNKYKELNIPYRLNGIKPMSKEKIDNLYKLLLS